MPRLKFGNSYICISNWKPVVQLKYHFKGEYCPKQPDQCLTSEERFLDTFKIHPVLQNKNGDF